VSQVLGAQLEPQPVKAGLQWAAVIQHAQGATVSEMCHHRYHQQEQEASLSDVNRS